MVGLTLWETLWAKAAAGDGAVFARFYDRHANRVFSHCYRRLGSRQDAEDLVAEVFALAWRHRDRVTPHGDADILPWLLTTANNLLRHHHRSVARARLMLESVPRDRSIPDFSDDVVDQAARRQELALIADVLDQLSRPEREIIVLCVLDGVHPTDLAAATGEPPGSVRSRLSRALARARRIHQSVTAPVTSHKVVKK